MIEPMPCVRKGCWSDDLPPCVGTQWTFCNRLHQNEAENMQVWAFSRIVVRLEGFVPKERNMRSASMRQMRCVTGVRQRPVRRARHSV